LSNAVDQPTHLVTVQVSAAGHGGGGQKLRLSLVWRTRDRTYFAPQDDVDLPDPAAPLAFDVRRPPPEAALHAPVLVPSEGTPMRFAHGAFVLYTDGNGNGTLDFSRGRAEAAEGDTIVGASAELVALWLERSPSEAETTLLADTRGVAPLAGLNFLRVTGEGARWVRSSEPLDVGAPGKPAFADRMCSYLFESPVPSAGSTRFDLDRIFPPAGSQGLTCAEAGRSLSLEGCAAAGLCEKNTAVCAVSVRRVQASENLPEGWPCPLE